MRKLLSKTGERLYPRIVLKVFMPGNKQSVRRRLQAPPGRGISAATIEQELVAMANLLESKYPQFEYKLVPLSPTEFNFVCLGDKKPNEAPSADGALSAVSAH